MKPTGAIKEWALSKPLTNQIISDDLRRGLTGSIAIHCIDIPEDGSDRVHFAGVIVFGDKKRAKDIVTAVNERERLREVLRQVRELARRGWLQRKDDTPRELFAEIAEKANAVFSETDDATPGTSADGGVRRDGIFVATIPEP